MKVFVFFTLVIQLKLAWTLEPLERYKEVGTCQDFPVKQVALDRPLWDSFHYLPAGSKWIFHVLARPLPNYSEIRTDELYYDFCPTRNTSTVTEVSTATLSGFGGSLVNYEVRPRNDVNIYIETRDFLDYENNIHDVVTLTDYKTYAFLVNCFMGSRERSWVLLSSTPDLHPDVIKIVTKHALQLRFRRDNIIFLRYDSCRSGIVTDNIGANTNSNYGSNHINYGSNPNTHYGSNPNNNYGSNKQKYTSKKNEFYDFYQPMNFANFIKNQLSY